MHSILSPPVHNAAMIEKLPLLIDTDPGVDDALALLMAFDAPHHEVIALTIAAGNVGLKHTVANALKLCEVAGVERGIGRDDDRSFGKLPSPGAQRFQGASLSASIS